MTIDSEQAYQRELAHIHDTGIDPGSVLSAMRSMIHYGESPILCMTSAGVIVYANPAFDALHEATHPEGTTGHNVIELAPAQQDRFEQAAAGIEVGDDGARPAVELPAPNTDGTGQWFEWRSLESLDDDGRPQLIIALGRDITQRKRVEQRLRQANDRLRESNRDLMDFAHVASHDLQEPLRKVRAFAGRLEDRIEGGLDEKGEDYLRRMNQATERMQLLIDDLLSFARVGTRGSSMKPTDLGEVLRLTLSDLEVAIDEAQATVHVGPLPVVACDASQIGQLFQNLIGNALKFRRAEVAPVIRVRSSHLCASGDSAPESLVADSVGGVVEIEIEDDGIGFDQAHAAKIFSPFKRLHGRSEYAGSGVGLSVCRRIVERHNGSIRALSSPGEGTTFVVRLPVGQPEPEPDAAGAEHPESA